MQFHRSGVRPSAIDHSHLGRSQFDPFQPTPQFFGPFPSESEQCEQESISFTNDDSECSPNDMESSMSTLRIAAEARTLLLKYQGDLFGSESAGASEVQGGRYSAFDPIDNRGLFMDASPRTVQGIALPNEFVSAIRACDVENVNKAIPRSVKRAFAFTDEDELQFFADKVVSPDTFAFAQSLRVPGSSSPLTSKDYVLADRAWASTAEASLVAARCAAYATALSHLLAQADELEVEEGDRRSIAELLVLISARSFTEAMRVQLRVTHNRRLAVLKALNLPKEFNCSAVNRVSREGPYVFGGQFLSAIDSDISMNKRAQEVADRVKPRFFRRSSMRGGSVTSVRSFGSSRNKSRGRRFSRRPTTRGRGGVQSSTSASVAPGTSQQSTFRK